MFRNGRDGSLHVITLCVAGDGGPAERLSYDIECMLSGTGIRVESGLVSWVCLTPGHAWPASSSPRSNDFPIVQLQQQSSLIDAHCYRIEIDQNRIF